MEEDPPRRMANSAMNVVMSRPRKGSLFLVTRANGASIGITLSLAIDWRRRGAPGIQVNQYKITNKIELLELTAKALQGCAEGGEEGADDDHPGRGPGHRGHNQMAVQTFAVFVTQHGPGID